MVSPGEAFQVETELCTGGWLRSVEDTWSPERTTAVNSLPGLDKGRGVGGCHPDRQDRERICCAGGIETTGRLTLQVDVAPKSRDMAWPRIETREHIITIGCARPAEDAFRIAVREMIRWMVAAYGFSETEAFLLLGQILHARCTQFVDPLYTYVCKLEKRFLVAESR